MMIFGFGISDMGYQALSSNNLVTGRKKDMCKRYSVLLVAALWDASLTAIADPAEASWARVHGTASDIAVGGNANGPAIWVTQRDGSTYLRADSGWKRMPGGGHRIAVDPTGNAWVVNSSTNDIWRYHGSNWSAVHGKASDIGIGADGSVWVTGLGEIFEWDDRNATWIPRGGEAVRVAVDPDGHAWVVNSVGQVWNWEPAAGWRHLTKAPKAKDVGVGADGTVWITGEDQMYSYPVAWQRTDRSWQQRGGGGENVSVDSNGHAWLVNAARQIFTHYESSRWMQDLAPIVAKKKIANLALPGSHDAGTYDFPHGSRAKNQNNNMWGQLAKGVRLLDLRTTWGGSGTYVMHHGGATSADSTGLNRVLDDIAHFAKGHPKELLLLDFHTSMQPEPHSYDELVGRWILWRFTNDKTILAPSMLPCAASGRLGACTLQDVWDAQDENRKGNVVIIIWRWQRDQLSDAYKGLVWTAESLFDCGAACEKANPPGGTNDYATYTETDNESDHFRTLGRYVDYYKTHERPANKLWLMYAQRLGGCPNPEACARTDNPKIISNLDGPWRGSKLNVISADFVVGDMIDKSNLYDLPGAIIRYNLHR